LVIAWVARFSPEVATVARPDTILAWYRKLVARKFSGSQARQGPGRPRLKREVEQLIIRMASQNRDWGYDRNRGRNGRSRVCDFRSDGWQCFATERPATHGGAQAHDPVVGLHSHLALLAGTDFFTAEVLTLRGLVIFYVLFFIHLESRRVDIAGITVHPDEPWMKQIARNVTMEGWDALRDCRYLLHDRDSKFTRSFRAIIASGRVEPLALPHWSTGKPRKAEQQSTRFNYVCQEHSCPCTGAIDLS
jgi:putative transposase